MWHKFPSQFEFNPEMLLFLAEHLYSCKYGNFLLNCHREREEAAISQNTISIWMEINLRKNSEFRNPYFDKDAQQARLMRIPKPEAYHLRVWREYFFRFSDQLGETPGYKMDSYEILYQ